MYYQKRYSVVVGSFDDGCRLTVAFIMVVEVKTVITYREDINTVFSTISLFSTILSVVEIFHIEESERMSI